MNEQDLRRAFAQITPDEDLIRATVEKVNTQRYLLAAAKANTLAARTPSRYAFAARLAGATCALVLAVGIGIVAGREAPAPVVADNASYTRTQFNDLSDDPGAAMRMDEGNALPDTPAASDYSEQARAKLLAQTAQLGEGWLILDAELSGCYILPEATADATECILAFDRVNVVAAAQGADSLTQSFADGTPAVHVAFADLEACTKLIDSMGSRMCVLVYADGDTVRMYPTYILAE
jgi:hypothetical protein